MLSQCIKLSHFPTFIVHLAPLCCQTASLSLSHPQQRRRPTPFHTHIHIQTSRRNTPAIFKNKHMRRKGFTKMIGDRPENEKKVLLGFVGGKSYFT